MKENDYLTYIKVERGVCCYES